MTTMAAQWAPEDIPGGPFVPIGERIRALRSERGWSQDELATKISAAGAHQISRYENGKITPATETVVRLAEVFDVSIDYLRLTKPRAGPCISPTEASPTGSASSWPTSAIPNATRSCSSWRPCRRRTG